MSELNDTMPEKPTRGVLREIVRDAVIVTALSALVAVGVNALQRKEYGGCSKKSKTFSCLVLSP